MKRRQPLSESSSESSFIRGKTEESELHYFFEMESGSRSGMANTDVAGLHFCGGARQKKLMSALCCEICRNTRIE